MKYSESNKPLECIMTESRCYTNTYVMKPLGVLWHSTGANNPTLKRYVQPSKKDANYNKLISLIGKNTNGNDWNNPDLKAGLNAWIGKLADGSVTSIQTLPWNYRPWGCASGSKGSCNDNWIQFEICEDNLSSKSYFDKVYKEACELTAYLCKKYNLNPKGTVTYNGVKVPVILCHIDSYKLGLGSNHSDVMHWFKKYGKTMEDVRNDVAALMSAGSDFEDLAQGIKNHPVNILAEKGIINSPDYWMEEYYSLQYLDILLEKLAAAALSKKVVPIKTVKEAIEHLVECKIINTADYWFENYTKIKYLDILLISAASHIPNKFEPYIIKITTEVLNIRQGPGTNYDIVGQIQDGGKYAYTIIEEKNNFGLLKSYKDNRDGWISLAYTKKV